MKRLALVTALACLLAPFSTLVVQAQAIALPTSITYRGAFDPSASYVRGDQVTYRGALYVALYAHQTYSPDSPVNSATAGYAPESGGLPAWMFLASGPLASATAAGFALPVATTATSNVGYFAGAYKQYDNPQSVTVPAVPSGSTGLVALTVYGTDANPIDATVTDKRDAASAPERLPGIDAQRRAHFSLHRHQRKRG